MRIVKAFRTTLTHGFVVLLGLLGGSVSALALELDINWPAPTVGMQFYGLVKIADSTLIAVGEHSTVATLTARRDINDKVDVNLASVGDGGLTAVCAWPTGTLVVTAQDGSIWRRDDKEAWALAKTPKVNDIDQDGEPLFNCWCGKDGIGLVVGAFGTIFRTVDYGRKWSRISIDYDDDYHLYDVYQSREGVVIVGEAGRIYRSRDQGKNWVRDIAPYNGSLFKAVVAADGSELVFGLRGTILTRSANGGDWRVLRAAGQGEAYFAALVSQDGSSVLLGDATGNIDRLRGGKIENVTALFGRPSVMELVEVNGIYVVATTNGLSVLEMKSGY